MENKENDYFCYNYTTKGVKFCVVCMNLDQILRLDDQIKLENNKAISKRQAIPYIDCFLTSELTRADVYINAAALL